MLYEVITTIATLAVGANETLTMMGTAIGGQYHNWGTASSDDYTDDAGHTETATASDDSSYFGTYDLGEIMATGTLCSDYLSGNIGQIFEYYYADQGGDIQYNVNKGLISSVSYNFV